MPLTKKRAKNIQNNQIVMCGGGGTIKEITILIIELVIIYQNI